MTDLQKQTIRDVRGELQQALAVPDRVKELLFDLGCYNDVLRGYVLYMFQHMKEPVKCADDFLALLAAALDEMTAEEAKNFYYNN